MIYKYGLQIRYMVYKYTFPFCKLSFHNWCKAGFKVHSFTCEYPIFPVPFIEGLSFPTEYSWLSRKILVDCLYLGLFLGIQFCSIGLFVRFYVSTTLF